MLKKILSFIIKKVLWILLIFVCWLYVVWLLCGCGTPNNLGGSYTRIYPITSYEMDGNWFTFSYTIEDGSGKIGKELRGHETLYFHEGEDTLVVISSEKDGKGTDGLKTFYVYLNSEKAKEYFGTMIDSMVENGG